MNYFFETAVKCQDVKKAGNTHFAIINSGKVRYLISSDVELRNRARKVLATNISSYSRKLELLMDSLMVIPNFALELAHLGKNVSVVLPEEITEAMTGVIEKRWPQKKWGYNIIVGSYVQKQKIVIQCFTQDVGDIPIYFKIGADNARAEIENETEYLKIPIQSKLFENPKLYYSKLQKDGAQFNIQATEEFSGSKVKPELTQEIYRLFQEIAWSRKQKTVDGKVLCFSHGDFVPWNLKRTKDGYIIFDWEYCGMRFYGFDLIHFAWQVENKLHKKEAHEAFCAAIAECKNLDKQLCCIGDDELEKMYFKELRRQFGEIL